MIFSVIDAASNQVLLIHFSKMKFLYAFFYMQASKSCTVQVIKVHAQKYLTMFKKYLIRSKIFEHGQNIFKLAD